MAKKIMSWKTKGMNRDLSVSAFNPEFAFENRNLRLGTNESNTTMSWVNERGTLAIPLKNVEYWSKPIPNSDITYIVYEDPHDSSYTHHEEATESVSIIGTPIGTAVINHQLVVFTSDTLHEHDYIYVLKYSDSTKTVMLCKMLFGFEHLSLGFDVAHPLETLVSYEAENIQKVYWVDGINQPRVVNIKGNIKKGNNTQFDFVPTLQLQEDITIKKILGASGTFAPGVIQYAFTYYTKYGQESNIFYTSPLLYISYRDRGASPEDKVDNAFKITVKGVDENFDYLRIYSIHRTSLNATPDCKRIQDIEISSLEVDSETQKKYTSYVDTGNSGDSVDPTELLYIGGEVITAKTLEQKDGTLFFGNLSILRPQIGESLRKEIKLGCKVYGIQQDTRKIVSTNISTGNYYYSNQLTAYDIDDSERSVPCAGFKSGDTYRLGVQFQYVSGKWSDPVYIDDVMVTGTPKLDDYNSTVELPTLTGYISQAHCGQLIEMGYKRVRPVVVFPDIQDRNIICQGVVNPTLFTQEHRNNQDLHAQASWFFRPYPNSDISYTNAPWGGSLSNASENYLPYTHCGIGNGIPSGCHPYNPNDIKNNIRTVEIQGEFNDVNKFQIDRNTLTFHSPDIEFDTQIELNDFSNTKFKQVGYAQFTSTMSDIDIQTETAPISNMGAGFVHKSFKETGGTKGACGIVAGLFYDDFIVDDGGTDDFGKWNAEYSPCKWIVYPWHKNGSLNNDCTRPVNGGTASAVLKKKIISNARYSVPIFYDNINRDYDSYHNYADYPRIFSGEEVSIIKMNANIYMGNIDTALLPDQPDGDYFCFDNWLIGGIQRLTTSFASNTWWKTFSKNFEVAADLGYYMHQSNGVWKNVHPNQSGDFYLDLAVKRDAVRMKYKSTIHLVFRHETNSITWKQSATSYKTLPILEIAQNPTMRFGGTSPDALKENIWLPCGEPVLLSATAAAPVKWEYGDTYFQRWDCLKTYAFTKEDKNQVIEIGSFVLETRVNIDGRYDKNRGQMNNLYMSPENFNLINPVYSQQNNFFQYRIQDKSFYEDTVYPNQITWAKTKSSGSTVDAWTNVTLASTLELDGDKGEITSLQKYNNQLLCFQDSSLARISYNETYQITTTEGVPVEVANSGKVQGKIYISDTVGCGNKWSITNGVLGLYFMDSDGKSIYLFNGQLTSLSDRAGFNSWCKLHIPSTDNKWTPVFEQVNGKSAFIAHFDRINQEVLFINNDYCLAFSEKFGVFTSFYDYHNTPYFCNLDDTGIWLRSNTLWKHQAGEYCRFFGASRPHSMILIGNQDPTTDKTFTNVEFRACVDGDGKEENGSFIPYLPFDSLDTWNEYQHGMSYISYRKGHSAQQHHTSDNEASLKRKFRIWACDIPRDNGDNLDTFDETFDDTFHPLARLRKHPNDRMRNPWLYLRFRKSAEEHPKRVEIHDIVMTYFD